MKIIARKLADKAFYTQFKGFTIAGLASFCEDLCNIAALKHTGGR